MGGARSACLKLKGAPYVDLTKDDSQQRQFKVADHVAFHSKRVSNVVCFIGVYPVCWSAGLLIC
jgi:hypothetical protein